MMNCVKTPQSRCRAAVGRCDITPPVGIYHRMWGAALHDRATGVHRPLTATLLWLEPLVDSPHQQTSSQSRESNGSRIVISLDHCILDTREIRLIQEAVSAATGLPVWQILVTLSHTHGSGWMSRTRGDLPGGELIGPYLDGLAKRMATLALETQPQLTAATIIYGMGRCSLAGHRDYFDAERGGYVCGYNPAGDSDDTLLVARIAADSGACLGTIVNYACHPTTLAWDNTLISPDWVGAMREVVEEVTEVPCLFLQGASADLGPREGFVGDPQIADRNGRQVGYAALSALTALAPSGTEYRYAGAVVSGATIGTWRHFPLSTAEKDRLADWQWNELLVPLPYRQDLPTIEQTTAERVHWLEELSRAEQSGNAERMRFCRAQSEQRTRQLTRLQALQPGDSYSLPVHFALLGDAIWIFIPGELYQVFQTTLRARFAPRPVIIATLTNDWQPGYIPPSSVYGHGIYQEIIAATAPGCLELLIDTISSAVERAAIGI